MQTKEKVIRVIDIIKMDMVGSRISGEILRNMIISVIMTSSPHFNNEELPFLRA
ncbi:MAG: hypothetical protein QXX12_01980 [Nanopusillaceae archaeon]